MEFKTLNRNLFFLIKKYWYWILAVFLIIIIFSSAPYLNKKGANRRVKTFENGVFSVGLIKKYRDQTRSDFYEYTFKYKGKIFKSRYYYEGVQLDIGQEYFIIIDPEKPGYNNFLLYHYPVPDSITSAPPEGWKELPISVDKEEIRKFLEDY
ncbi:MAG: hypothetical protein WBF83_03920 [Moheibacter sp.]